MSFDENKLRAMIADMLGKDQADRIEEVRAKAKEPKAGQVTPQAAKADEDPKFESGYTMVRALRYLHACHNSRDGAKEMAYKAGDQAVLKAMGEGTLAGGGALVSGAFAEEIVPVLSAKSVIRDMGIPSVPMPDGGLSIPYGDSGATAAWVGESSNITNSEPTTAVIQLVPKKLAIIGAASRELLEDSSGRADRFLREDLARAIAVAENSQLIRGAPSANAPTSLKVLSENASTDSASAGTSLANVTADLVGAIYRVENGNVQIDQGGWIMAPRSKWALMGMLSSDGQPVFRDEMREGSLMGYPFKVSTAVPINLSGSNSEVYFGNFSSLILGEGRMSELSVHDGAAYHNGSAVVSALSLDQVVYKVTLREDFNARFRGAELSLITSVAWS